MTPVRFTPVCTVNVQGVFGSGVPTSYSAARGARSQRENTHKHKLIQHTLQHKRRVLHYGWDEYINTQRASGKREESEMKEQIRALLMRWSDAVKIMKISLDFYNYYN